MQQLKLSSNRERVRESVRERCKEGGGWVGEGEMGELKRVTEKGEGKREEEGDGRKGGRGRRGVNS